MDNMLVDFLGWQKLPEAVMKELVGRVRQLRKARRMSLASLASLSGVSLGSLKRFEQTGHISLVSLLKVAYALQHMPDFDRVFEGGTLPKSLDELIG